MRMIKRRRKARNTRNPLTKRAATALRAKGGLMWKLSRVVTSATRLLPVAIRNVKEASGFMGLNVTQGVIGWDRFVAVGARIGDPLYRASQMGVLTIPAPLEPRHYIALHIALLRRETNLHEGIDSNDCVSISVWWYKEQKHGNFNDPEFGRRRAR
jgi:hypothetical protein